MHKTYTEDSAYVVFEACGIFVDPESSHLYLESSTWETRICLTWLNENDEIAYETGVIEKDDEVLEINFARLVEKKTSYLVGGGASSRIIYLQGTLRNGYGDLKRYSQYSKFARQEHDKAVEAMKEDARNKGV